MKTLATCLCLLLLSLSVAAQDRMPERSRLAAIVVYDNVELLDFAGPAEALSHVGVMRRVGDQPALRVIVVAPEKRPVRTQNSVTVAPDYALRDCPEVDILVIPGGATNSLTQDEDAMAQVRRLATNAEINFSVCTGAHVLGSLGLLDGIECTTHWGSLRGLQRLYPEARVVDRRVVDAGSIVTCAGVAAGIDGALHVVMRLYGAELAEHTADYMEYDWQPDRQPARFAGRRAAQLAYANAVLKVQDGRFRDAVAELGHALESGFAPATAVLRDSFLRPMREDPDARLALSELLKQHAKDNSVTMVDREEPGRPIRLRGRVVDAQTGTPLADALVQFFHTDAGGEYRPGMDAGGGAGNPRLFGYLRTDPDGRFTVDTIMPERYPDSSVPRHVHYRVWAEGYPEFESECFFDSDPLLTDETRASAPRRGFPIVVLEDGEGELTIRVPR